MSTTETSNDRLETRDLPAERDQARVEPLPDSLGKLRAGIKLRTAIKAGILPAPLNQ
jgi:hypothetical protein